MGVRTAVIMAGGKGSRMFPISKLLPKWYLPILDEPLIIKQINWLISAGVEEIIITINKDFQGLISYLLPFVNNNLEANLKIIIEEEVKGIGYSLLQLKSVIGNQPFIFMLGDEYFEHPEIFKYIHEIDEPGVIMGAVEYFDEDTIAKGCNFQIDENLKCINRLIEKPKFHEIVSNWCWSGVAVLNESIFLMLNELIKNSNHMRNEVLINAINNVINSGVKVQYFIERYKNINLTDIEDYYKAIEIEYFKKREMN